MLDSFVRFTTKDVRKKKQRQTIMIIIMSEGGGAKEAHGVKVVV